MFSLKKFEMVLADDIRKAILLFANERGVSRSFFATEVARYLDPVNWNNLIDQVRFVASVLIKEGKIRSLRSGNHIDILRLKEPARLNKDR
jgi:Protein of unknown function (DUF3253)